MLLTFGILCCIFCNVKCSYVIDSTAGPGRRFDGIGGLSGGGATSKLLVNYPETQRNEILDYLFRPNFAASLDILKVEIGGDSQSTDGTESSHMHEANDENYQRGYEWWLMGEAKKRNPDIKLYGLPWAFPGWIGQGTQNPYSKPNITSSYIIKWIQGAKKYYNLTIDYIGIWNERNYDITYIKTLRRNLDEQGLQRVRIVAADGDWGIATDMLNDTELYNAIDYIGVHYPGTTTSSDAVQTGKQLWSSEDYSTFNDNVGAGCWARILNQNYVNGNMTSTISWNLIAAYYQDLPFGRDGLMTATEPWSGHYVVESPIWITAHTTQFTEIGWHYLPHGSGAGHLDEGGSYVSLVSPDGTDLTIVIETMSHDHSKCIRPGLPSYNVSSLQLANFQLKGPFAQITQLQGFYSKLGFNGEPTGLFERIVPVKVTDGIFKVYFEVDMIVTLTTLTSGHKGQYDPPPVSKPFPLPYLDTFQAYREYEEAANFAPQIGVFEVRDSNDTSHRLVNMQVMLHPAVDWCYQGDRPITIGGNYQWRDVAVGVDASLSVALPANATLVAARISKGGCDTVNSKGVFFFVNPTNQSFQVTADFKKTIILKEGPINMNLNSWYRQVLTVKGDQVSGNIGGHNIFAMEIRTDSKNGFVGYGTDSFGYAVFDNFMVEDAS